MPQKISIITAVYNGEKYLLEQLNSYISQERLPDELVICDDVSTDKTVSIISDFKKKAPFQVEIIINPIKESKFFKVSDRTDLLLSR